MPPKKSSIAGDTVPCALSDEMLNMVEQYAEALRDAAPTIGGHGLSGADFWSSGLFHSAIERLRGQRAASTKEKYAFVAWALDKLKAAGLIADHKFRGLVIATTSTSSCLTGGCASSRRRAVWTGTTPRFSSARPMPRSS